MIISYFAIIFKMDDDEIIESESFLENQNAESVNDESEIVDQPTVKEMQEVPKI